jgi:hypothetical protein
MGKNIPVFLHLELKLGYCTDKKGRIQDVKKGRFYPSRNEEYPFSPLGKHRNVKGMGFFGAF